MDRVYAELLWVLEYAQERQEATNGEALGDVNLDFLRGVVESAQKYAKQNAS